MCDSDNSECGSVMVDGITMIRLLLESILHPSMSSDKPTVNPVVYSDFGWKGSSDQTNNLGQNESPFLWESNLKRIGRS